jgi:hypothetical protein
VSDETITGRAPVARAFIDRMIRRLRWVAVGGLAAVTSGVLVLGIGGRLVMFLSRVHHPDAVGRFTENGNRIGEFTVEGTLALLVFGGLAGGLFAAVVWVIVKQWIPDNPLAVGLGAVAMGGFLLIEADNRDFLILSPPGLDLAPLLALVFLFGVVLHRFDKMFDSRLPARRGPVSTIVYMLLAAVGIAIAIPAFGNFFSPNFCACEEPPVWTGVFLAVTAIVTLSWWVLDLRGVERPPASLQLIGRLTTAAAAVAGSVHLVAQIVAII